MKCTCRPLCRNDVKEVIKDVDIGSNRCMHVLAVMGLCEQAMIGLKSSSITLGKYAHFYVFQ